MSWTPKLEPAISQSVMVLSESSSQLEIDLAVCRWLLDGNHYVPELRAVGKDAFLMDLERAGYLMVNFARLQWDFPETRLSLRSCLLLTLSIRMTVQ